MSHQARAALRIAKSDGRADDWASSMLRTRFRTSADDRADDYAASQLRTRFRTSADGIDGSRALGSWA